MTSLRMRLALSVAVAVPLIGALATVLYAEVSNRTRAGFDRELVEDAQLLAEMIEVEPSGHLELDFGPVVASFARGPARTHWTVWDAEGRVLAEEGGGDWLRMPGHDGGLTAADLLATDGVSTRVVAHWFEARVDPDDGPPPGGTPEIGLAVARETAELDAGLQELAILFWLLGLGTCVLVGGTAMWQAARGIAPVRRLAAELDRLGPSDVGGALDASGLPSELVPFVVRLNVLLLRLHRALEREREFTGHIAHELRTPLSILRTGVELAMRKESPGSDPHRRLVEMLATVDEMTGLVDNLLLSARLEGRADPVEMRPVAVRPLVDQEWRQVEGKARERGLRFENRVPDDHRVPADPANLRIVLRNLLRNAVSYTERGGRIEARADTGDVASIWDSGPQLEADELERAFDRLWRSDKARTDATKHAGLGLALAKGLCEHMGFTIRAQNDDDGGLRFVIGTNDRS